jgi:MATE family multidrug resistance protein
MLRRGNEAMVKLSAELVKLHSLALAPFLTSSLDYAFLMVDLIMLGHLGKGQLAAGFVGFACYSFVWHLTEGVLTAQDTLVGKSMLLQNPADARYWTYIALAVTLMLCCVYTVLFVMSPWIIQNLMFVPYHIAHKASQLLLCLIPALWFHSMSRVVQKYLQMQGVMLPTLTYSVVGITANALCDYLFMYVFGWGFVGCGIATSLARLAMLWVLALHLEKQFASTPKVRPEICL